MHAHHVGKPVVDRVGAEGAAHGIGVDRAADGAARFAVGGRLTGMPILSTLLDEGARLAWMDKAGIDIQLVSGWMDLAAYHLPPEAGQWFARVQNEALAELVSRHSDRFVAAAMVPLQAPELAAEELRYAVRELGHRAVQIGARVEEEGLDAAGFDPFWRAAEELNVSPHTIRAWIAQGRIACVRLGRAIRVPAAELKRLIEAGRVPAIPGKDARQPGE